MKTNIKLIIAGGRDYHLSDTDREYLNKIHEQHTVVEVVSGGCLGVDRDGEEWAAAKGIPVKCFNPQWEKHGKSAGPIRNRQMAQYADAVMLFPGGRGTANMRKEAEKAGIIVWFVGEE